ncbi:hypothetical protein TWF694_004950 [Orbilia ellipsospora]|uniref:CHAT domain-containing protein n=1 Tax=Orbilia ellipsospora TaxID=2528407 RepID=A0AAV9WVF1_9PEZI
MSMSNPEQEQQSEESSPITIDLSGNTIEGIDSTLKVLEQIYPDIYNCTTAEGEANNGNDGINLDSPIYELLGFLYYRRYQLQNDIKDREKSITRDIITLSILPPDSDRRPYIYSRLSSSLLSKYLGPSGPGASDPSVLDHYIEICRAALAYTPDGAGAHNLVNGLVFRFKLMSDKRDINEAMDALRKALNGISDDDPTRPEIMLTDMSLCSGLLYENSKNLKHLDDAIWFMEQAKMTVTEGSPELADILLRLGDCLTTRYETTRDTGDCSCARKVLDEAQSLRPNDRHTLEVLTRLDKSQYRGRDDRMRVILDSRIKLFEEDRKNSRPEDWAYVDILGKLAAEYDERCVLFGDIRDLELALKVSQEAMDLTADGHVQKFAVMVNHAECLMKRYRFLSSGGSENSAYMDDLVAASTLVRRVLQESNPNHPDRHLWLQNYGHIRGYCYTVNGDPECLDDAIRFTAEAIAVEPGSPATTKLRDHGHYLGMKFQRTGDISYLNQAIEETNRAIDSVSRHQVITSTHLCELGELLGIRFERLGAIGDLDHAIDVSKQAISLTPKGSIDLPRHQNNLSNLYFMRYGRTRHTSDLDESINILKQVLEEWDNHNSNSQAYILVFNIATRYHERGKIGNSDNHKVDLDQAIQNFKKISALLPGKDHSSYSMTRAAYGDALNSRFMLFGHHIPDINRSIELVNEALSVIPPEHQGRSEMLLTLAKSLENRYKYAEIPAENDQTEALNALIEAFRSCSNSPPDARIESAKRAANILDLRSRTQEAAEILDEAIHLFPLLSPRHLSSSDQEHALGVVSGVATLATAFALKAKYDDYAAVMLLERGRGVIASLLMETQINESILGPKLANEYLEAKKKLGQARFTSATNNNFQPAAIDGTTPRSKYIDESLSNQEAEESFQKILRKIRSNPETQDFLLPPSQERLMKVLGDDIIVMINVTEIRCDAFVITKARGTRVVELTNLKAKDINEWAEKLKLSRPRIDPTMLEWLWDNCAELILRNLGLTQLGSSAIEELPRIIWIPTGSLTPLPIHAAGRHENGSKETVMDTVISSYSSSLRAFVRGREAEPREKAKASTEKALLVGMHRTPGLSPLRFVTEEVEMLKKLCARLDVEPLGLLTPTREAVLGELNALIFHFAGHGRSHPENPSESGLHLEDGILTVADIQANDLGAKKPFLGYLSACLTGASDVDSLVDEGINLVNACQLVGFRHVVGTLYQVDDKSCVQVAESFYEYLAGRELTDRAVSVALHVGLVRLRNLWVEEIDSFTRDAAIEGDEDAKGSKYADGELIPGSYNPNGLNRWREPNRTTAEIDIGDQNRNGRRIRWEDKMDTVRASWVPYVHYGP